jgi:anaerobic selenocysteine-containing dehydrogenase
MTTNERLAVPGASGVHIYTCPLCEATCGLELNVEDGRVVRVRGDRDDVYSAGHLCPKGVSLGHVNHDPDILTAPQLRDGSQWSSASWDDAFALIDAQLGSVIDRYGQEGVALYFGNPVSHSMALSFYIAALIAAVASPNVYSTMSLDSVGRRYAAGLMFGSPQSLAVPDIDRTSYMLILGANPAESNGSLWTVPDVTARMKAVRKRGGRLVVVDPRRTRTADLADEHIAIRPGGDACFLLAIAHTLIADTLTNVALGEYVAGLDNVRRAVERFAPERVESHCGIDAATIRRIAHELAGAPAAIVYGRIGTSVNRFGTVTSWIIDVINVLTGNLDRPGGVMFPRPVAGSPNMWGSPGKGRGLKPDATTTRVRGYPRVLGEFPVATLADEILEPGPGQIRALICVAGNPARSAPDSARFKRALCSLELMVSVDLYRNETSCHADVILPPVPPLQRPQFDAYFYRMATRHIANYSPPVFEPGPGARQEWSILSSLALIAARQPHDDIGAFDDKIAGDLARRSIRLPGIADAGVSEQEVLDAVAPRTGPDRLVDISIRSGPYGDWFGRRPDGLSIDVLEIHPHGVDLGPLEPRVPEVLRTPSGKIELAPPVIIDDLVNLEDELARPASGGLVLIGRRQLRSNNSWMHNIPALVRGKAPCTLLVHPDDAAERGLSDGAPAVVTSGVGRVVVPVEISDVMRQGAVSLPHGWGHDAPGAALAVASQVSGVNSNMLTDSTQIDRVSGSAVLNGLPVTVEPA